MPLPIRTLSLLAILAAATLPTLAQDTSPLAKSKPSTPEQLIRAILAANDPSEAEEHFHALFRDCTADELKRFEANESDTIALLAAWQAVELTVPVKEPKLVVRPDRDQLARFLGFLEGRGRVHTPAWWSAALLDARANRRGNIYAGGHNMSERREANPPAKAPPEPPTLVTADGKTTLLVGKTTVPLPADLTEKIKLDGFREQVSALLTPTRCYVAAYSDVGYSYQLACVDRETNKTLWTTTVWSSWWGGATGQHHHWVELTEQNNRLITFGIASVGFHAEAFQATDGKNLWRFSNGYSR